VTVPSPSLSLFVYVSLFTAKLPSADVLNICKCLLVSKNYLMHNYIFTSGDTSSKHLFFKRLPWAEITSLVMLVSNGEESGLSITSSSNRSHNSFRSSAHKIEFDCNAIFNDKVANQIQRKSKETMLDRSHFVCGQLDPRYYCRSQIWLQCPDILSRLNFNASSICI